MATSVNQMMDPTPPDAYDALLDSLGPRGFDVPSELRVTSQAGMRTRYVLDRWD